LKNKIQILKFKKNIKLSHERRNKESQTNHEQVSYSLIGHGAARCCRVFVSVNQVYSWREIA